MNHTIIDTHYRFLELRPNLNNDSIAFVSKRRENVDEQWETECFILTREEALQVRKALSEIFHTVRV